MLLVLSAFVSLSLAFDFAGVLILIVFALSFLNYRHISWGQPAVGAAKAIREMKKQNQVAIVCTDADRPVLAEMAKKDAPAMACLGLVPKENGAYAAKLMDKALQFSSVKEAKANMNTLYVVPTALVSNTKPKQEFEQKRVMILDEAWEFFHKGKKRPW